METWKNETKVVLIGDTLTWHQEGSINEGLANRYDGPAKVDKLGYLNYFLDGREVTEEEVRKLAESKGIVWNDLDKQYQTEYEELYTRADRVWNETGQDIKESDDEIDQLLDNLWKLYVSKVMLQYNN